jgi:hypothetical protein
MLLYPVVLGPVTSNGAPLANVAIVVTDHPPAIKSIAAGAVLPNR